MYYVRFCSATVVASLILFKGFNTTNTVSLLCGFVVTFLGFHILNLVILDETAQDSDGALALGGGSSLWHDHVHQRSTNSLNSPHTPLF
jgi:hypothetical protein